MIYYSTEEINEFCDINLLNEENFEITSNNDAFVTSDGEFEVSNFEVGVGENINIKKIRITNCNFPEFRFRKLGFYEIAGLYAGNQIDKNMFLEFVRGWASA